MRNKGVSIHGLVAISEFEIKGKADRLTIGAGSAIGRALIQLHGKVSIGNCVVINDDCKLITGTHDVHEPDWPLVVKPIIIKDFAWVATGAVILPGVVVGRGAVVGAGAVVSRDVGDCHIVVGNPARSVGKRRAETFSYTPARQFALIEAWLGPDIIDSIEHQGDCRT